MHRVFMMLPPYAFYMHMVIMMLSPYASYTHRVIMMLPLYASYTFLLPPAKEMVMRRAEQFGTSNKKKKLICEPCLERALTVTTTSSLLLYVYGGLGIHTIRLVAALRKDLPGQRILMRQCESNILSKLLSEAALAPLTSGSTADTVQCQVLLCTFNIRQYC
ncbi:hypothetical protein CEUSTIGMA_g8887.t1 [Chlamydomonas eustigma]|uniref:Uncharacterized protein n=1 Tax=Chlamydomonas eustigma TaxID=1157962 RepID=A0A250XEE5_9CHLO|nr:hypothetical protein CEUSTIGMA_g8887.t1 [Chlamydomonas eustigma]|eukprot:GAX81458.1 hypothetical protein CEUSTIGMA_g8887.t1 [Chlamydomonas eustigma]